MKLLVPYIGELEPVDLRLIRLAEFLGIESIRLPLAESAARWDEYFERVVPSRDSCLVVNPRVLRQWVGGDELPANLASILVRRFPHVLFHAPSPAPFDCRLITALSGGSLHAVQEIEHSDASYQISGDSRDICEAFAGLSFGPANPANDRVFSIDSAGNAVRNLISIAGRPLMSVVAKENSKVWFLAGEDVADLDAEVGEAPLSEYFSRLLPPAMALRSIFGEESWRPGEHYASVVIDDPLLRRNYGFLNFESLLDLTKRHNFHSTIAFIPHNFKRSSPRVARLFWENTGRLALCFHGNDHTRAEFASTDTALLNTLLQIAETRIEQHKKLTGVDCDRVMVFPQGHFSVEAMRVLKSRNFDGAVNTTPHPLHDEVRLTLAELAQPAVLRYGNFPLFLRKDSNHTQSPDIAFDCFVGRPVLIVEHHDIFEHPEPLAELAARINQVAPDIHWSNLGTVLKNSILSRQTSDGVRHVRAYSRIVQVSNVSDSAKRCVIEWKQGVEQGIIGEQVLADGALCTNFTADAAGIRVHADLPANRSRTFSVVYRNPHGNLGSLGFRRDSKAFVRRRLSELRDNYLTKSPRVLAVAKTLQRYLPS